MVAIGISRYALAFFYFQTKYFPLFAKYQAALSATFSQLYSILSGSRRVKAVTQDKQPCLLAHPMH
jgi:hypothetical protein